MRKYKWEIDNFNSVKYQKKLKYTILPFASQTGKGFLKAWLKSVQALCKVIQEHKPL